MNPICVVGSWHLATVMSACFAERGYDVVGVDDDEDAIKSLSKGTPTIFEPDMDEMVARHVTSGRLRYTTDFKSALKECSVVFLAKDTTITADSIDLGSIEEATRNIAENATNPYVLVISSQVPVGTCEKLLGLARETNKEIACEIVCNPEFLRLGNAIDLCLNTDRVVLGAANQQAVQKVEEIYQAFGRPILKMSLREAEMVKHATNAYVATSVSFIGEISQLCDEMGADAWQVGKALKLDRRIGKYAYVMPGLGFNGGTVARDVKLLIKLSEQAGKQTPMLQAVLDVNERQNGLIVARLQQILGHTEGLEVGILGLTYKAQTSTLRHSLTLKIAKQMIGAGMKLKAYDPIIPEEEFDKAWQIRPCGTLYGPAEDSDALVIMTGKDEFSRIDLTVLASKMRNRVLVDMVNLFDPEEAVKAGFKYVALGRGFTWKNEEEQD